MLTLPIDQIDLVPLVRFGNIKVFPDLYRGFGPYDEHLSIPPGTHPVGGEPVDTKVARCTPVPNQDALAEVLEIRMIGIMVI